MPSDALSDRLEALRRAPVARALAAEADRRGVRAWLVGGAVRDAALGLASDDLDAVVERDASGLGAALARTLGARLVALGGERFGAVRLVRGARTLDLWDLAGAPLASDLARRDFTINAVALDVAHGDPVDPHGGLADLERRILRSTRDSVFEEDPLRVIRLARFAATLPRFAADPATRRRARAASPGLARVAGERLRQELLVLWTRASFATAQRALAAAGAWPTLWRTPGTPAPDAAAAASAADVLDEIAPRAADTAAEAGRAAAGHALAARAAAGAAGAPAVVGRLFERRALARAERDAAFLLLDLLEESPPAGDADLAWFLHRAGTTWRRALGLAAGFAAPARHGSWRALVPRAARLVAERGADVLAPVPLLAGEEVAVLLGTGPGPEVGAALRRLLEAQVRGEVRDAGEARALLALRPRLSGRCRSDAD